MRLTRQIIYGVIVGGLIFLMAFLFIDRQNAQQERVERLEEIAANARTTLEELRAAIAAGPEATDRLLARIREEMEREHAALLRAIREEGTTVIHTPSRNGDKDKPKPKPKPTPKPFPTPPNPPPFPPFLISQLSRICNLLPFC